MIRLSQDRTNRFPTSTTTVARRKAPAAEEDAAEEAVAGRRRAEAGDVEREVGDAVDLDGVVDLRLGIVAPPKAAVVGVMMTMIIMMEIITTRVSTRIRPCPTSLVMAMMSEQPHPLNKRAMTTTNIKNSISMMSCHFLIRNSWDRRFQGRNKVGWDRSRHNWSSRRRQEQQRQRRIPQ